MDDVSVPTAPRWPKHPKALRADLRQRRHWYPAEAPGPHLRLSFAGVRADWVAEAVESLAEVIADAPAG